MFSFNSTARKIALYLLCTGLSAVLLGKLQLQRAYGKQVTGGSNPDAQIVTDAGTNSQQDGQFTGKVHDAKAPAGEQLEQSWSMLTSASQSRNADVRVEALAAFGTMGSNNRSSGLIEQAMNDTDVDVRTAAVLAAVQTDNRNLTTGIRKLLNDKEPQVAFTAATALWKMKDRSGEDILLAVVDGERSASPTLVDGTMHDVSKQLHHPASLARMGAMQGVSMFLGPFGYGLTAYQYMHKSGGNSARVLAVEALAEEKTGPVRQSLRAALRDKDPVVRAAAAKALGWEHDRNLSGSLYAMLDDPRQPVRLTAAAACINSLAATTKGHSRLPHP